MSGVVLLVQPSTDEQVTRGLAELGLHVVLLTDVRAAAARVGHGDVRCVVVDLSLSPTGAIAALRGAHDAVPVVAVTGRTDAVEAVRAGADDCLVAGECTPERLVRAVRLAVERAGRQAAEREQLQLGGRLQLSEAQRLARIGSWEWDVRTGQVSWSPELRRMTGLPDEGGAESFARYLRLVAEEDRADAAALFSLEAAEDPPVVVRHRLLRGDGTQRWVQGHMTAAVWDAEGRPVRVLGTMQDITEQKNAEDLLEHQALHDSLTGLVNRGVLLDRLSRVLVAPRSDDSLVAVIFLDVDHFTWVNDSRNHAAGDRLLVALAHALAGVLRPTDTLSRFGGDEFVVLCERVHGEQEVLSLARRLSAAVEQPVPAGAAPDPELAGLHITASMGIATARPGDGVDAELLVRDADIAMYRAKELGRARFEVFDEQMRSRAMARLQTQTDLQSALLGSELDVHYQPVVDPRTGVVIGTEALVRWEHPRRGLLLPEEFVPHAEETGLILQVGAAVLASACATTAAWNRGRRVPLTVAVNLSGRQLSDPDLLEVVAAALTASGLPGHLLCLEVTESVVMEDAEASARVLGQLRTLGVRVAVDDFGTGYSSLAYLLSLPVDLLKVDRSFVAAIDEQGPGAAIVTTVLALAQTLDLAVVAEGVETLAQRRALVELGVTAAQGWLWGPPVPAAAADWALSDRPLRGAPPLLVQLPSARDPLRGQPADTA